MAWAMGAFAQAQMLSLEYFGEDKGLNVTALSDIYQDKAGFLWLATREGLVRYDGHTFHYFHHAPGDSTSISSNNVLCIAEDAENNIWVGLVRGGVSCYNRSTGTFRNYRFTEKLKLKTASVLRIFFDRDGEIWLGVASSGLVHLDKKTGNYQRFDLVTAQSAPYWMPEERPNHNAAYNFWQDETGLIWCATSDDLYTFDPKTGRATPRRTGKINPVGTNFFQVYALYPDGDLLWLGGWASGLRRYNRKTGEWKQFFFSIDPQRSDAINIVNGIARKSKTELWISTQDKGLGVFNTETEQFFFFADHPDAYPDIPKSGLGYFRLDKQGNIWTNHKALLTRIQLKNKIFHFQRVQSKRKNNNEPPNISDIFEDREGRFRFVATNDGDGLEITNKKTGQIYTPTFEPTPSTVDNHRMVIGTRQAPDGTIWVANRNTIYRFNTRTMRLEKALPQPPVYSSEMKSNWYTQFDIDPEGNLWLGTPLFGVFKFGPNTGQTTHFMPDEKNPRAIATNIVGSIAVDRRGRTWYGSRDKTAYGYYSPAEHGFFYLGANGEPTTDLASLRMNSFFTDRAGNIWACTEQGMLHFDCSGAQPRLLKKYTVADGLASDYVSWGVEDANGQIWCIASHLCRLDPITGAIVTFGKRDGLPEWIGGIGKLNDGTLFLKSGFGYYTFDPKALSPARNRVPIVLTSFKVDDQENYRGSEVVPSQPLVVPANSRFFSVEFAALDLSSPEVFQYEYQLDGFDNQWVSAGTRHFVNYTNIPRGFYLFKVKRAGAPDNEALVVPLTVKVPFYRMGWFWAILSIVVVGFGIWFYRAQRVQEQQMAALKSKAQLLEKEKAVVMYESLKQQLNPHFLFNSLTSLGSLIQIDPKAAAGFLDNLSKTYRYILKSSERELVPLVEELKFSESFIKLQKTRFEEGLVVNFGVPEALFHRKIVPVTLQNLLENAIKHNIIDEDTPLVVDVFIENDCLVVRNNLQKKKFVETSNRKGLAHLQSFYQYLSDRKIETQEDGQFFTIKVPLI